MRSTLVALALAAVAGPVWGQTSYPMITHVTPAAVQRGQTATVVVSGQQDFAGAYAALVEGAGVTAEVVPAKGAAKGPVRSVALRVKVGAKAAVGVREFRIASGLGLSSVGQLVICDEPVVAEKGDNNTREKAQAVPAPCVVAGKIEVAEDTDHYRFKAKAGQAWTFEVLCARIQDKIHDLQKHADPILTLYDSDGRELASNDDHYFADPLLSYTFKKDGEYVIQVRDSKYDGDPRWAYALLVTDRPYASHAYPMGVQAGKAATVGPVGSAALAKAGVEIIAPAKAGLHEVELPLGGGRVTNPVPLIVSDLPQASEAEPNDDITRSTQVTLPCGINGRIGAPRDVDHFNFAAKKGKAVRFEVKARRFGTLLRSGLDSVLDVLDEKGRVLATSDDANGKDALVVFTPPADGPYYLRVRDLNSKGGPTFVYYIEADYARPDFALRCDGDKAMIGPGARAAWYVQLTRQNGFTGPVKVEVRGLPAGMTASELTIPEGQSQGVVVLSAAAGAKRGAARVEVVGSAELRPGERAERVAAAAQEIYFPGGGRGVFDVNLQAVAVTDGSDILEVKVSGSEVVLRPGGEVKLEVEVVRGRGMDKGVTLDVLLRHLGRVYGNPLPAGVTVVEGKSKTLLGKGSKGHIVLRAAADAAAVEGVPIAVVAHVSVNFVVKVGHSSEAIRLSVRK